MLEFRLDNFFLGLLLLSIREKVLPFCVIFEFFHHAAFAAWRIVVIHDSWKDRFKFLKTVFLNYLFVLLYLLYSVFNEHLLYEVFASYGGLKWTRTIDLALIRRAL